jgi:hypothetical protein
MTELKKQSHECIIYRTRQAMYLSIIMLTHSMTMFPYGEQVIFLNIFVYFCIMDHFNILNEQKESCLTYYEHRKVYMY